MRALAFLLGVQLATASPVADPQLGGLLGSLFGGLGGNSQASGSAAAPKANPAPGRCKNIPGDAGWPADEVWLKLPNVEKLDPIQGQVRPLWRVWAQSPQDVVTAVKFANQNNVRLSVVNSGHDFLGRNDAASGLSLSVTKLKGARLIRNFQPTRNGVADIKNDETPVVQLFVPGEQAYVTFGAGMSTKEINYALADSGLMTVGAAHPEVATAGGWGQAGGHSPLGIHYGMGVDNVVEYKVVTPDGVLRVANSATNPDLFWALRGGGGSTFGVVTQATVKAHPSPKITSVSWFLNTTDFNDQKSIFMPAAYLHTHFPHLVEIGVSGYYYIFENGIKASFMGIGPQGGTTAYQKTVWEPILNVITSFPGISKETMVVTYNDFPNFKVWFDAAFGLLSEQVEGEDQAPTPMVQADGHTDSHAESETEPAPGPALVPSPAPAPALAPAPAPAPAADGDTHTHSMREIDARNAQPEYKIPLRKFFDSSRLIDRNVDYTKEKHKRHEGEDMEPMGIAPMESRLLGPQHFGDQVKFANALEADFPRTLGGQYRGNLVSGRVIHKMGKDVSATPAWRDTYTHLIATGSGLPSMANTRALSPASGEYVNEASYRHADWKKTFWGPNYQRLSQIKSVIDPNGVLWVTPGINADMFAIQDGRLCKLAAAAVSEFPPGGDNTNLQQASEGSNADGAPFPLIWNGTAVVVADAFV